MRGFRHPVLLLLLGTSLTVQAQQYRSEVRMLEDVPEESAPADPEKLLRQAKDPYERALLLRELAARAASDKRYGEAARLLKQAVDLNALAGPAQEAMEAQLSQMLVGSGDADAIIRTLGPMLRRESNPTAGQLATLGTAYAVKKRYHRALPLLQRAVRASDSPEEAWLKAKLASEMGLKRYGAAGDTVRLLLARNPREAEYWEQAVALKLRAGDKREAQAAMETAARLGYINTSEKRRHLAALTAEIGVPFVAATQLERWLEGGQVARNARSLRELAGYWLAARESKQAIAAIEATLARSQDFELLLQLGQESMDREDYARAVRAYERALSLRPGHGDALMALAVSRYQLADVDGALTAFQAAAETPKHQALAARWVEYLQSDRARQQALAAATERARRLQGRQGTSLQAAVLGESISLGASEDGSDQGPASARARSGHTPVGAEAGPSADGVIPAWEGGLTPDRWPTGFAAGERLVDPFATDKPLYTVTAENVAEYRRWLSDGHQALLARYDDYRMPVYPTRRSVSYPPAIYKATRANRKRARLIGSDSLKGASVGFPFPKPENGVEVLWNHRVRYRGNSVQARSRQAVVLESGRLGETLYQTERAYFRYANLEDPVDIDQQNILLYYLTWFSRDPSEVDFLALAHETADAAEGKRAVWVMPPRTRRMFRIPPVGYDQPFPGSGGLYFVDMIDMYNGPFDRYVWKLVGKQELIVPYNGFRLVDGSVGEDELLRGRFPAPEYTRYERHRVWVVEATLREGATHSFGKRVFYVDEDSWNIVLVENFDPQGRLWRFQEGHLLPLYDIQAANAAPAVTYDLREGSYFINRMMAETPPPQYDVPGIRSGDFLPSTVKARYSH